MLSKLKDKRGSFVLLVVVIIMCVFIPMLGIMYDLTMMRIYRQDLRNIQEVSGIVCIPEADGLNGAFKLGACQRAVQHYIQVNLGLGKSDRFCDQKGVCEDFIGTESKNGDAIRKLRQNPNFHSCKSQGVNVYVVPVKGTEGQWSDHYSQIKIQIQGMCYRPVFLRKNIFNWRAIKSTKEDGNNFADEYPILPEPTIISSSANK